MIPLQRKAMQIRRYTPDDRGAAEALVAACYQEAPRLSFLTGAQVVLGEIGGQLVGLAGVTRNALHPTIVAEYICVHPDHRRRGLATALHHRLLASFPPRPTDTALDISCFADQEAERRFIEHLGFVCYLDCALCVVPLAEVALLPASSAVVSLDDCYRRVGPDAVKAYFTRRYCEEHQGHLPVSGAPGIWDDYYDDGDTALGAVLLDGDEIVGCSLVYQDAPPSVGGYASGVTAAEEAHRLQLLYSHQFRQLQRQGAREAYVEVDSTERVAPFILRWLPSEGRTSFLRHQREV